MTPNALQIRFAGGEHVSMHIVRQAPAHGYVVIFVHRDVRVIAQVTCLHGRRVAPLVCVDCALTLAMHIERISALVVFTALV
jgi:hypothetical protein